MSGKKVKLARKAMPRPVTVDFETFGIEPRPHYPPKPVGISIKYPGKKAHYYAFGHPTNNNCTEAEAKAAAKKAWGDKNGIRCQNAKFDVDVAEVHWGLAVPKWESIEDTMFLIFLDDPNQQSFSLKPASERLLGLPPDEQDAVGEWLVKNQPVPGVKISTSKKSPHYFGRYIAYAPGDLVGKYANGDTIRTEKVGDLLWKKNAQRGMQAAYDRERKLMPMILEMERQGLPVNRTKLRADVDSYVKWLTTIDMWIEKRLGFEKRASTEDSKINLNSSDQLFDAMLKAGVVDKKKAVLTPTGKYATNKDALLVAVKDKQLLAVLKYRTQLNTCLNTFMIPWLTTADTVANLAATGKKPASKELKALLKEGKSLIFTSWNQVKGDARGGNVGARTGRLSSTPNFQNIPKVFIYIFAHQEAHLPKKERKGLPKCPIKGLPDLPHVRSYVVAFSGDVLIDRDYSQQEPRILAHFDGGALLRKYIEEPWVDFHDFARAELAKVGLFYERKQVKNTNLGIIYGMGVGELARRNDMEVEDSKKLKGALMRLYPGLKEMYQEARRRAKAGEPVRTWGGREYYCEPPRVVEGRFKTFDYKLPNALIQGSAADCTKEAIIRFYEKKHKTDKLLLNVHDQLTASVARARRVTAMAILQATMESVEFDVKMLTEGSVADELDPRSDGSWDGLKDVDKKGKVIPFPTQLKKHTTKRKAA